MFESCLRLCVSLLGKESFTDSRCLTLLYVGFFGDFLVTSELGDDRFKVAAAFRQFG